MLTSNNLISSEEVKIDIAALFGLSVTLRIRRNATIQLSERSYIPKVHDPRSDWVASVAVPAFLALKQTGTEVRDFCAIGTGAGLDALAAIEILSAQNIIITDLHDDVVTLARQNIIKNTDQTSGLTIFAGVGDLLHPVEEENFSLDLVYENLPNIPIHPRDNLEDGQNSSTFIANRSEKIPDFVSRHLITLHYLALEQAFPLLRNGGHILSSIGGRIPVEVIVRLGEECGYSSEILTFTWKRQSEPEEVITGYAKWEHEGFGPFQFYPAQVLEEVFRSIEYVAAGAQAHAIEQALSPHAMTAQEALEAMKQRIKIGHTVAVLDSVKR
ncbi:class I SAM-dependent methyltransferase [Halomonas faecis]|uniref:class I SAM-dependent methyltransferase n=1 Tax=Halomonas faecis TaxID=1562110 RepID=UPI0013D887A7|nr:class I SAM-dependent methyltransferase [Halomonas faecis]